MKKTDRETETIAKEEAGARVSRREALVAGASLPLMMGLAGKAMAFSGGRAGPVPSATTQTSPPSQTRPEVTLSLTDQTLAPLGQPTAATLVMINCRGPSCVFARVSVFRSWLKIKCPFPPPYIGTA